MCQEGLYALQNDFVKIGNFIFTGTRGWQVPERDELKTNEDEKLLNREYIRLELSLASAKQEQEKLQEQGETTQIISLIHYPPFNSKRSRSKFVELFEKYGVSAVVYGHIHGKHRFNDSLLGKYRGRNYSLVSGDYLNWIPKKIMG